jgi:hypothetical protein
MGEAASPSSVRDYQPNAGEEDQGFHHENLLGQELANDDATDIFYGFLQVFQQRVSMRCVVSDNTVF